MSFPGLQETKKILASRAFITVFVSLLAISLGIAYVSSESRQRDGFLSLTTFGSDMMLDNYFPNSDPTVGVGDTVRWHVNVYNLMGSSEYVSLRVSVLNSTETNPDLTPFSSQKNLIIEMQHVLMNNSTWTVPLNWEITGIKNTSNFLQINSLEINGKDTDDLNVQSTSGRFSMVLELWRYDNQSGDFTPVRSTDDKSTTRNQIWFNVA